MNQSNSAQQIKAYVDRFMNVGEEISVLREDQREILKEAKSQGFDTKAIRHAARMLKKDPQKRLEEKELNEIYEQAVGI